MENIPPKPINLKNTKVIKESFDSMVNSERDALENALYNWKEIRLSEDGSRLTGHIGREGEHIGNNAFNTKYKPTKKEFLEWLNSEEPFNTKVYGENITKDTEWVNDISRLRNALKKSK
jgi:hypothetical protein